MKQILTQRKQKMLNRIQSDFPIITTPFIQLSKELQLPKQTVLEEIKKLKHQNIIRRIGAVFDSNKLGFKSLLIGLKVHPQNLDKVGIKIAYFKEVTHCYARQHEYNLWFTVTSQTQKKIIMILSMIRKMEGVQAVLFLPAVKTFKIRTEFKLR